MGSIASNWKALSGIENNWNGLLDPIDNNLRRYLVHYGQRVGAVQDSFNDVEQSEGHGLSRYPLEEMLNRTGLEVGNPYKYTVIEYFYGRSEVDIGEWRHEQSAYIGYVAVGTEEGKDVLGRRDIMVCWRGTQLPVEWLKNVNFVQTSASEVFPMNNAKVHQGFLNVYTDKSADSVYSKNSAREQVLAAVRRQVDKYAALKEEVSITVAGHSLGGALATLNAMDIAFNGFNKPTNSSTLFPVTAFVYASPRVGDKNFLNLFNSLPNLHLLNIRNPRDIVPDLPPDLILTKYSEVGVILDIITQDSPHIKTQTIIQSHDLNLLLYGIAAYQGQGKEFKLGFDFDVAIVNKYQDLLIDDYKVPPNWWSNVMNKGLVQMENGFWKLNDYIPPPPLSTVLLAKF